MTEIYCHRTGLHNFVRQLLALNFLPANHIPQAFESLWQQATTEKKQKPLEYIFTQWISSKVLPMESWSVCQQTIRTNIDVDGKILLMTITNFLSKTKTPLLNVVLKNGNFTLFHFLLSFNLIVNINFDLICHSQLQDRWLSSIGNNFIV